MPREVMPDATVIMVYFVPFQPWVAGGNRQGEMASADWAQIYEETNAMFPKTQCTHDRFSESRGYRGAVSPQSVVVFTVMSWSVTGRSATLYCRSVSDIWAE